MDRERENTMAPSEPEVLFEERGALGILTLNRPKALNALTLTMVRLLTPRLIEWAQNPSIRAVIIRGAGGKAFCAGGDIRALYDMGKAGNLEPARAFWREEYQLNRLIKHYPKPYISLIDGIVMGGGVGLSAHGSHRVAGDKYLFAMPEVGIGFFPDVGATYFLPRLPGWAGTYLALTGARIGPGDALALGLATHSVPSNRLEDVVDELAKGAEIERVLRKFMAPVREAALDKDRALIHSVFVASDVATILGKLDALAETGSAFARETASIMRSKSPTSMAIALEQMRRGRTLSFDEAMKLEYQIVSRIAAGHDFYEGVRAVLVDKDQKPKWHPARIEEVEPDEIQSYFSDAKSDDLTFPKG